MLFPSYTFLFFFLPITVAVYLCCPNRFRNLWLLGASLFFYVWGAPNFVGLLLLSSLIDYVVSLMISRTADVRRRKVLVSASLVMNVGFLIYYKYFNFFIDQLNHLNWVSVNWTPVILPIGISFFTFHKISYVVDVYRGVSKASRNVIDYLLYITFFPQLIAGPIVRYHEIEAYLVRRSSSVQSFFDGANRFCIGLGKKVLLADPSGAIANNIFNLPTSSLSTPYCWIGAIAYSVQLYFDFSGYSDMAIGLAKIFGFTFPENFNRPYIAKNFTDFWRRWHMSLSRWMRDYLYIPLGGNRGSPVRTYINLWTVFLLSGLWHGANWTFLAWGAYHGIFLIFDRLGLEAISRRVPKLLSIFITYLFVLVGWVLFRSQTFSDALTFLKVMFRPVTFWEAKHYTSSVSLYSNQGASMLVLALIIIFVFEPFRLQTRLASSAWKDSAAGLVSITLFLLSCMALASGRFSPFIYFQF